MWFALPPLRRVGVAARLPGARPSDGENEVPAARFEITPGDGAHTDPRDRHQIDAGIRDDNLERELTPGANNHSRTEVGRREHRSGLIRDLNRRTGRHAEHCAGVTILPPNQVPFPPPPSP